MATVTQIGVRLIRDRGLGYWMALAAMDASVVDETNPVVSDAVVYGMGVMGQVYADALAITDADIAAILPTAMPGVIDYAHIKILEQVRTILLTQEGSVCPARGDGVTVMDLIAQLNRILAEAYRRAKDMYGEILQPATTGFIDLGIVRPSLDDYPPGDF